MNPYIPFIKQMVINYLKSFFGKGPESIKITISDNIIYIEIKNALTILETSFIENASSRNVKIIKYIRKLLFESKIDFFTSEMRNITKINDLKIENYLFDLDYNHDNQIVVIICNKSLSMVSD